MIYCDHGRVEGWDCPHCSGVNYYPLVCKHGINLSTSSACRRCQLDIAERAEADRRARWPTVCAKVICGWWHPPGWTALVSKLADLLERIGGVHCDQCKEKFGGLRFYVNLVDCPDPPLVWTLIKAAEEASYSMCQDCGGPGVLRKNGTYWVATLCDKCGEGWKVCK